MTARLHGVFDGVSEDGWATGWALFPTNRSKKAKLSITIDGSVVADVTADHFRQSHRFEKLADPFCAFFYQIDERYLDGVSHDISVTQWTPDDATRKVELENSPMRFALQDPQQPTAIDHRSNLIPNSAFLSWPSGLKVDVSRHLTETAARWFVDFKPGTAPAINVSLAQPSDHTSSSGEYGLSLSIREGSNPDFVRFVVPLNVKETNPPGTYVFSCDIRKPVSRSGTSLRINNIVVVLHEQREVTRIITIRGPLSFDHGLSLKNLAFTIDKGLIKGLNGDRRLSLIIDFTGDGECVISQPQIVLKFQEAHVEQVQSGFEDDNIARQVAVLKLPPHWQHEGWVEKTLIVDHRKSERLLQNRFGATPFIQIVVPVHNAATETIQLVESIRNCTGRPYEVILADDGSEQRNADLICRAIADDTRFVFVRQEQWRGYTKTVNAALRLTSAPYVVVMNSDLIVTSGWLEKMHQVFSFDPSTVAVGPISNAASWQSVPRTKTYSGEWAINKMPIDVSIDEYAAMIGQLSLHSFPIFPILNGFCTMFRREAIEIAGFYDEENFPKGYGEENDLCLRLRKSGGVLRVADHCFIYHHKSRSFGSRRRAELSKKSSETLTKKHPTEKFKDMETEMSTCEPLNHLRRKITGDRKARVETPRKLDRKVRLIRSRPRVS